MGAFKKDPQNLERNEQRNGIEDANTKVSLILEGITDLLLVEEKASMAIPVAFYFALLLRSLSLNLIEDLKTKLHKEMTEKIVKMYVAGKRKNGCQGQNPSRDLSVAADL
jgi:hypothetical protein